MKHLQKLPKNAGDSVFLGTPVAFGIQPERGDFFISFDCNGELVTYLIDNPRLGSRIIDLFVVRVFEPALANDDKFINLTQRADLRCTVVDDELRIFPVDQPENYESYPLSHR